MYNQNEWDSLAKIVYKRTYARRKENGELESWPDTVDRVIRGNTHLVPVGLDEREELRNIMLSRKGIPAGRGLWQSGTDTHKLLGGASLNNCFFWTAENYENFVYAQDYLMLGGGVGLSVEHRFVSKLPKVKKNVKIVHKNTYDAEFIVPDSREGWCDLTRRILKSYFVTGKSFTFSTKCIRGYGEPIKGFGGVASGPAPLLKFVEQLCSLLDSRAGKHIRPIDAADILCMTGQMVVAGNVRRSAIIILGDCWDKEYLRAKQWSRGNIPNYRAFANFSIVASDMDDVHPEFWKTYENGEPFGIINREAMQKYGRMAEEKPDTAIGVNPCQPAFATVLTPEGIKEFKDIDVGSIIWSGNNWTKVIKKWSTGVKPVYQFETTAGSFIGTENHRILQNGEKIEVALATEIDTCQCNVENYHFDNQTIMDGLVLGDGMVHRASNNLVLLNIGIHDSDYHLSEISNFIVKSRSALSDFAWEIKTTITAEELDKTFLRDIPERFFKGNVKTICSFLRGLYSANGSIVGNRITLKASSFNVISKVQQMLSAVGIKSYYTTNKSKSVEFENGTYICKESYDLNISVDRYKFAKNIGFIQKYKTEKLLNICEKTKQPARIKSTYEIINKIYLGDYEVFDITVDDPDHTYWTGGLLVSNCAEICLENGEPCCLVEIPLMNISDESELFRVAYLLYRYAKRVTMETYHNPITNSVVHKNHRIGIGLTGCLGSPLFNPATLSGLYKYIQREDEIYSKELGVPPSIRLTTIKPSGTVSKLLSQQGYEGIHAAYSKYFIQRIRFASDDPLIPKLREAGHHIEPQINFDGTLDHNTLVVDFYVKTPDGYPVADEDWTLEKQLETVLTAQRYWSDNSVSVTVYYKKEDIPFIKEFLSKNLNELKSISFLMHSEHGFKQAPKEAITKEQYEKAIKKLKPLNIDEIAEGDIESMECTAGFCPVK